MGEKTFTKLNDSVGLDVGDRRDARRAAKMHKEIHLALKAYPHQHMWMDRVRPANQLAGLAQFNRRLAALIETFEHLDDTTWRDLDQAHEPGSADARRDSSIRFELDRIAAAATLVENTVAELKQRKSAQHPPTKDARRELIKDLVQTFAKYAPKKSKSLKDERQERLNFIKTVLKAAGVPCPKRDENLRALIG